MNKINRSSFLESLTTDQDGGNQGPGVGVRQGMRGAPLEGGEYLNSCDDFETSTESDLIKINDLKKLGLSSIWLEIAEKIGIDQFLVAWEILDRLVDPKDRRLRIPAIKTLSRHFRNQLISSLKSEGLTDREIAGYIRQNLNLNINQSTVNRSYEKSRNLSESFDRPTS